MDQNGEKIKECYHPISDNDMDYDKIDNEVNCPNCGIKCEIGFDEWYDDETDEVYQSWWLMPVD